MRSCFPCGRRARVVLEPTAVSSSAHRCSPSSKERECFNELMNKDPSTSLSREVETHLNTGSFDDAETKYMDFSSQEKSIDAAVAIHSPRINAKEEESAHATKNGLIPRLNGYGVAEKEELVVSANLFKNGTVYSGELKREDECKIFTGMNTPIKEIIYFKEEKKENILSSSAEDDFIEDKELNTNEADKDKLSRKVSSGPAMLVETSVKKPTKSLLDSFADEKELLKKLAIPEDDTTYVKCGACDTDNHQNPEPAINMSNEASTQDGDEKQGAIRHEDYNVYYNKPGVATSRSKLQSKALFSYGISDQQRDFLFLCAGLVLQAVGFQLRSLVEVATALILLCYRAYIFACHFADMLSHAKQKLAGTHALLFSYVAIDRTRIALHKERWESSMKPLIIQGAKKMGWGCLNAAYVLAMLGALLLTSFLFSYLAVKGGATQKPIHIEKELFFDYTKDHPMASLDLFSLDDYSRLSNATKRMKVNPGAGIRYRCTVLLTLPESEHNRKLGVFQVRSEVVSEKGEIMVKGSQPCMLAFKSSILHHINSMAIALPVLTGLASEAQTLRLQLLEWHHNEITRASAHVLQITLVPRAGLATISTGLPQLYKAHLQLDSLHVGPYSLPMSSSSSILRTLFMWIFLSFLIFGCLSTFCMYRMQCHKS